MYTDILEAINLTLRKAETHFHSIYTLSDSVTQSNTSLCFYTLAIFYDNIDVTIYKIIATLILYCLQCM